MTAADLTGSETGNALIAPATRLVWAVRIRDVDEVDAALDEVVRITGGGMRALAIVLAAMVPDDESPGQLLGWLADPEAYLDLHERGYARPAATEAVRQQPDAQTTGGA